MSITEAEGKYSLRRVAKVQPANPPVIVSPIVELSVWMFAYTDHPQSQNLLCPPPYSFASRFEKEGF